MEKHEKDKIGEETLVGTPFFEMVMKIFDPSYLKVEEEIDKIRINPAKQPDSMAIKNGSD